MRYRIVLVHGTFAPNAPWTSPASSFCKELKKKVKGEISIESFNWSGKNSHNAWTTAAAELTTLLKSIASDQDAEKIIIAHSHGGNIALYALRNLGEASTDFSLVTMATPYLNPQKGAYNFFVAVNLFLIPFLLCTLLLALVGFYFDLVIKKYDIPAYCVTLLYCVYLYPRLFRITSKWTKRLNEKIDNTINELSFAKSDSYKRLLAIIDERDEITTWFKLLSRGWKLFISTQKYIMGGIGLFIGGGILYSIYSFFNRTPRYSGFSTVDTGIPVAILITCLFTLAFLLASIVLTLSTAIILTLLKSNTLMLGRENWFQQLFINIVPAPIPASHAKFTYLPHRRSSSRRALRHSIYNDEVVARHIGSWILYQAIPLDQSPKQIRVERTVTLEEFENNPEKIADLAVLLLAAGLNSSFYLYPYLPRFNLSTEYIDGIKIERAEEIADVYNSRAMRRFDEVIVVLCMVDKRNIAEIMYANIKGKDQTSRIDYVGQVVRNYNIDMSKEKKRKEKENFTARYQIFFKIGMTLFCGFVFYCLLDVVRNLETIDSEKYWMGIFHPFVKSYQLLYQEKGLAIGIYKLGIGLYFLLFTL